MKHLLLHRTHKTDKNTNIVINMVLDTIRQNNYNNAIKIMTSCINTYNSLGMNFLIDGELPELALTVFEKQIKVAYSVEKEDFLIVSVNDDFINHFGHDPMLMDDFRRLPEGEFFWLHPHITPLQYSDTYYHNLSIQVVRDIKRPADISDENLHVLNTCIDTIKSLNIDGETMEYIIDQLGFKEYTESFGKF